MRSEVVKIHRYDINHAMPGTPDRRIASNLLSEMCPEIKVGETKSVRISVEIVDEREEEKVGSYTASLLKDGNKACLWIGVYGYWYPAFDHIVKDWKDGEARPVKIIRFDTPSGVPVVEFIETPRERLRRALNAASILDAQSLPNLYTAVNEFFTATEGEGK